MNRSRTTKDHPYNLDGLGNVLVNWCIESWEGDKPPYSDKVGRIFLDKKSNRLAVITESGIIYCGVHNITPYTIIGILDNSNEDNIIKLSDNKSLLDHKLFKKTKRMESIEDGFAAVLSSNSDVIINDKKHSLSSGDIIAAVGERLVISRMRIDDNMDYNIDNKNNYGYIYGKSNSHMVWVQNELSDVWKVDTSVFPSNTQFSVVSIQTPGGDVSPIKPPHKDGSFMIIDVFYRVSGVVTLKATKYESKYM